MKQVLDLRPVFHRLKDRIRAHVLLCWLALLLARIVETRAATHDLAPRPRRAATPARRHLHRPGRGVPPDQHSSPETRRLHTALDIALPPRILDLNPEQPATP